MNQTLRPLTDFFYRLHDYVCDVLLRSQRRIKWTLLTLAHLSLFGFLFPEWRRDFGQLAINLLIFLLFLSPLSQIFRTRLLLLLMSFRREIGIMMGYLATVHGLGYLLDPDWSGLFFQSLSLGGYHGVNPSYLFGIFAYILTLPLLFTSNTLSQRLLGAKWKTLHRIVYLMFVFALLHQFLVRRISLFGFGEAVLFILSYGLVQLLSRKSLSIPLLTRWIDFWAEDYRSFRTRSITLVPTPSSSEPVS